MPSTPARWYGVLANGDVQDFGSRQALRQAVRNGNAKPLTSEYVQRIERAEAKFPGISRTEARGHRLPKPEGGGYRVGQEASDRKHCLRSKEGLRRLLHQVRTRRIIVKGLFKITGNTPYSAKSRKGAALGVGQKSSVTVWLASTEFRPDVLKMANDPTTTLLQVMQTIMQTPGITRVYQIAIEPVREQKPRGKKRRRK